MCPSSPQYTLPLTCVPGWRAQLLGFSDWAVATISTCLTLGLALGFLMGGSAGDWLAMRFPNIARPAINQLSLLLSIPTTALLYKAMPGGFSTAHCLRVAFTLTLTYLKKHHSGILLEGRLWYVALLQMCLCCDSQFLSPPCQALFQPLPSTVTLCSRCRLLKVCHWSTWVAGQAPA